MKAPTEPHPRRTADAKARAIRKSLGLVGNGDEMYLVVDIERAFSIKLMERDLRDARTVGDLDDAIWRRLGRVALQGDRCMTAMAFYAIRRALKLRRVDLRIGPATRLSEFAVPPKALANLLEAREGLQFSFGIGLLGQFGWILQLGWLVLLWALLRGPFDWALPSIIAVIAGMAAIGVDRGAYARGETVGDLARRLARRNFGALAAKGGRANRAAVWNATRQIAADLKGVHPDEIGRDTILLAKSRLNPKV